MQIPHGNITDWASATSGFLTSDVDYVTSVSSAFGVSGGLLSLNSVNYGETSFANQNLNTGSSPDFSGLSVSTGTVVGFRIDASFGAGYWMGFLGSPYALNINVPNDAGTKRFVAISTTSDDSPTGIITNGINFYPLDCKITTSSGLLTVSGNLISSGTVTGSSGIVSDYLSGDYGLTWGSLPTFPTGANGMYVVLWNTNAGVLSGRIYVYANGVWHYSALT